MQCWKLSSSFFYEVCESVCDRDVFLDWGCGWACRGPCKEPKASATAAVQELFWLQLFDMQGSTRVWHRSIRQSTKASTRKLFPNSLPRYHFASVRNVPLIWSSLAKHDMQPTHTQTMSTWLMHVFLGDRQVQFINVWNFHPSGSWRSSSTCLRQSGCGFPLQRKCGRVWQISRHFARGSDNRITNNMLSWITASQ